MRQRQQEQEERLAIELEKQRHVVVKDQKLRQQIREQSHEIRDLETKLREAYMNKERAAQIAEKEALKFDEAEREAQILRIMQVGD